jgi:hypothetical protein
VLLQFALYITACEHTLNASIKVYIYVVCIIRRDLMYGSIVGYASLESSIDDGRMKKEEEGAKNTHTQLQTTTT